MKKNNFRVRYNFDLACQHFVKTNELRFVKAVFLNGNVYQNNEEGD